jgi:UDP-N-acetylmuramate dehydrogenase
MQEIYNALKQFGRVKANEPLSKHTTFKVGGPASFLVMVEEREKLIELLNFLNSEGVERMVIGGGANLLFSDEGYEGVVVKVQSSKFKVQNENIESEAGVLLGKVMNLAMENSLQGMEWAAGVPGTVGGAVRGNAGAMGEDASGGVEKVEVWRDGEVLELNKKECGFGYRDSAFKHNNDVILRVWFKLPKGDRQEIAAKVNKNLAARQGKFPPYPSAGCFFKNVELRNKKQETRNKIEIPERFKQIGKIGAGWLVEQVEMKGERIGDAQVGPGHCNFIVNLGAAKSSDILALVEKVKEAVYNKFRIELENEVEIVN